jgi:hypothetical protein
MIAPIARFDTGQSHLVAAFQARHLKGGLKARAGWRWAGYLHGILIFKRREGETPPRSPTQKLCTVASGIIGGAGQEFVGPIDPPVFSFSRLHISTLLGASFISHQSCFR